MHKTSSRCIGRGRSQTKLNKFCPLLTTYLSPPVDIGEGIPFCYQGKSAYRPIPTYLLTSSCQRSLKTPLNLHSEQALLNWILTWTTSYFRILQFFSSTSFALQLALGRNSNVILNNSANFKIDIILHTYLLNYISTDIGTSVIFDLGIFIETWFYTKKETL